MLWHLAEPCSHSTGVPASPTPSDSPSSCNYLESPAGCRRVCVCDLPRPLSPGAAWRSDILPGQPCLSTSARLVPAPGILSFCKALCTRRFGQELEVSARTVSPTHPPCFLSGPTDRHLISLHAFLLPTYLKNIFFNRFKIALISFHSPALQCSFLSPDWGMECSFVYLTPILGFHFGHTFFWRFQTQVQSFLGWREKQ